MGLDPRARRYLKVMGIEVWEPRAPWAGATAPTTPATQTVVAAQPSQERPDASKPAHATGSVTSKSVAVGPAGDSSDGAPGSYDLPRRDWDQLARRVSTCTACALHEGRTNTVFGVGDRHADWMVIGEAPGSEEDRQGEPFVGRAGRLLNAMLEAVGLSRGQVYIANTLKCRPPGNRDPRPEEMSCCRGFLARQIELVRPRLILSVGRISAQSLLQSDQAVGRLRGTVHRLPDSDIALVVTYHPAYLLRKPTEKRKAWADLKLARTALRGSEVGSGQGLSSA